eukprot:2804147-Rhodomonas_salina.1
MNQRCKDAQTRHGTATLTIDQRLNVEAGGLLFCGHLRGLKRRGLRRLRSKETTSELILILSRAAPQVGGSSPQPEH